MFIDSPIVNNDDIVVAMYTALPVSDTCNNLNQEPFLSVLETKKFSKLIFIDYFERSWNNQTMGRPWLLREEPFLHEWFLKNSDLYFKREKYPDMISCIPYPEPTFHDTSEYPHPKKYDIFCSFPQKHTGLRREAIDVCEKLLLDGYNVLIKDNCSKQEYIDNVKSSYITIDAHGAGQINHRFLEIIALRSVCCRQRYTVEFYKDYDSSMIIEFASSQELYEKLKAFVNSKKLLEVMEERAHNHYNMYHTKKAVGKYLFTEISQISREKLIK
jgi:hypothetical protein